MSEPRKFTGAPAVRAEVPLWIGLYGATFSGKTYSALRLATGLLSVCGGKIGVADTENKRATHYAGEFTFNHYHFTPPFDPLSYLAVLEQMAADGITVAIIDSASHEHEGQGGVLEMHESECLRLMKAWKTDSRDKVQISAWNKPKTEHRRMVQTAQRLNMHIIWCFRAKEKLDVNHVNPKTKRKEPKNKGFMPIGADDLVYEMLMTALLMPGAKGHPTWNPGETGEKQMVKLPHFAQAMLREGHPLNEHLGASLGKWAKGESLVAIAGDENIRRADLYQLYDLLDDGRKAALAKALPSRDAIGKLSMDRVEKAIPILTQALEQQTAEWLARREQEEQDQ